MKKQSMITLALLAVLLLVGTGYAAGAAGAQAVARQAVPTSTFTLS